MSLSPDSVSKLTDFMEKVSEVASALCSLDVSTVKSLKYKLSSGERVLMMVQPEAVKTSRRSLLPLHLAEEILSRATLAGRSRSFSLGSVALSSTR